VFAGKKSAQIREILISESAWEEMTCLFAPSLKELDAVAVQVEKESAQNTILDSGSDAQVVIDRARNAFRATPVAGN